MHETRPQNRTYKMSRGEISNGVCSLRKSASPTSFLTLEDGQVTGDNNSCDSNISRTEVVEGGENEVESNTQGVYLTKISNQLLQDYNPLGNNATWGCDWKRHNLKCYSK